MIIRGDAECSDGEHVDFEAESDRRLISVRCMARTIGDEAHKEQDDTGTMGICIKRTLAKFTLTMNDQNEQPLFAEILFRSYCRDWMKNDCNAWV